MSGRPAQAGRRVCGNGAEGLTSEAKRPHALSGGAYGAPRALCGLRDDGWTVSEKTVAKAMRRAGACGTSPRSWHPQTTVRGAGHKPVPDPVCRAFDQGGKGRAWTSDITYLRTGEGFCCSCVVRDGHTRRVLGRAADRHMRAGLAEAALKQAAALRGQLPGKIVFHADRGCQYTSEQVALCASGLGLLRSMGKTGACFDNAPVESFWPTLKNEYCHRHVFKAVGQARQGAYGWIDGRYNAKRRHPSLGYISPLQYEQQLGDEVA
ncbi:MAG: IS3 family transposase [Coriobacteriia bacterium]|nr:IS3 family transposase [Coriobacteriia bacterium]